MEPEQPALNANQDWQRALDPQLTGRLLRPLTQPGVISPNLGRNILSRMQRTGANMPLLDKALGYMRSIEDPRAAHVPIVYARPARPAEAAEHLGAAAAEPAVRPVVRPAGVQRAAASGSGIADLPAPATARLSVVVPLARRAPTEQPDALIRPERGGEMPVSQPPGATDRATPASDLPTVIARSLAHGASMRGQSPAEAPALGVPSAPRAADVLPLNDPAASADEAPASQRFVLPAGRRVQRAADSGTATPAAQPVATPSLATESAVLPLVQERQHAADPTAPLPVTPGPRDSEPALPTPGVPTARVIARSAVDAGAAQPTAQPLGVVIASAHGSSIRPIQRRSAAALAGDPVMPIHSPQRPAVQLAEAGGATRPVVAAQPTPIVIGRTDQQPARASVGPISPAAPVIARMISRAADTPAPQIMRASDELAATTVDAPIAAASPPSAGVDINLVAAQVYELLVRRIASERERRGM